MAWILEVEAEVKIGVLLCVVDIGYHIIPTYGCGVELKHCPGSDRWFGSQLAGDDYDWQNSIIGK